MKKLYLIIYYIFIKQLPSSFYPLGGCFNYIRIIILKKVIRDFGIKNKIQKGVYFGNGQDISIGSNCQINENVKLDNVVIGNYVMIAPGVTILGKMHNFSSIETPMILQGEKKVLPTIIEDDTWIGTNAIIMPGITISKGSIIGAGSVVTKNTNQFGIYAGVPAKLIKYRV